MGEAPGGHGTDRAGDALSVDVADLLRRAGLDPDAVAAVAAAALLEDLAGGTDVTTDVVIAPTVVARGALVARADGVVAGLPAAAAVFECAARRPFWGSPRGGTDSAAEAEGRGRAPQRLPGAPEVRILVADGALVRRGDVLMTVTGALPPMLVAERTALNLLCHLSGVATVTRRWVDAVAGTGARVRDTRKTLPGLRSLQKYAVRCGGGVNHRMSLSDAVLVKDNHVAAAGSLAAAFAAVRDRWGWELPVEVECDTVDQVAEAVRAGAEEILLDNFTVGDLHAAVRLVRGRARLEASGGLMLDGAREVASTGVDYLAVGALTHSAPALDIGLDLTAEPRRPPEGAVGDGREGAAGDGPGDRPR